MNLAITITEESDNSIAIITDTTTDWGAGEIQSVFDDGDATLDIVILGVIYDQINVKTYFDGGLQSGLVFVISPGMLQVSGDPKFSDNVPDGDWDVTYTANHIIGGPEADAVVETGYLYGIVEEGVLEEISVTNLNDWQFDNTFYEALLIGAWYVYLEAITKAVAEDDLTSFRTGLANLEIMLANKSY